jgi:hypothetical protein
MRLNTSFRSFALVTLFAAISSANPTVVDLEPGSDSGQVLDLQTDGTRAFFWTSPPSASGSALLWETDGSARGTRIRKSFPKDAAATSAGLSLYQATPQGLFFESAASGFIGNDPLSFLGNSGTLQTLGFRPGCGGSVRDVKRIARNVKFRTAS